MFFSSSVILSSSLVQKGGGTSVPFAVTLRAFVASLLDRVPPVMPKGSRAMTRRIALLSIVLVDDFDIVERQHFLVFTPST
jgi:hypothetical protein